MILGRSARIPKHPIAKGVPGTAKSAPRKKTVCNFSAPMNPRTANDIASAQALLEASTRKRPIDDDGAPQPLAKKPRDVLSDSIRSLPFEVSSKQLQKASGQVVLTAACLLKGDGTTKPPPLTARKTQQKGGKGYKQKKCPHGRQKVYCKECGGGSICEHNRRRSHCKHCGGGSLCSHERIRSTCKDCGFGPKKCPHGRQKAYCKECGGSGICLHNRRRTRCKECGGGAICKHERERSKCKECIVLAQLRQLQKASGQGHQEQGT
jgi:hypothetical protein